MARYLYSGVELPALPEHDEAHKYAAMCVWNGVYTLLLSTVPFIHEDYMSIVGWQVKTAEDGESLVYQCIIPYDPTDPLTTSWQQKETRTHTANVTNTFGMLKPHWANFNILKEDDSVYLPASYPIDPETGEEIHDYEIVNAEPIDPTALLMGYLMG